MNRLLQAAAAVRARLSSDWAWLQTQFERLDTTAPGAPARLKGLEQRREGMVAQLELVEAAEAAAARPDFTAPFAVLLGVSDFADVPLATDAQRQQARRIARWQAHADQMQARYPNGLPPFAPGWDAALLAKQLRNPNA